MAISLAETLYALPTERLRALARERGVSLKKLAPTPAKRQVAQHLAAELVKAPSIAQALLYCNARELRLLQLLSALEDKERTWNAVLERIGGPELADVVAPILAGLAEKALAFRVGSVVFLPEGVRGRVPASLPDRYTLARCLKTYDAPALKRIFHELQLGPDPGSNPKIIEAVCEHLLNKGPGLRLHRPLDAEEREVLEYLVQAGGCATPVDAAAAALGGRAEEFYRYDWQSRWKQGRSKNAIDRLLELGIVHVVSANYGFNLFLLIPGDLLRVLSNDAGVAFWTGPPPAPAPLAEPPPASARHETLLRDVVVLLAHLEMQEAVRTNTGHIHKSHLKALSRSLSSPDERYAAFLYAVCREAGLIEAEGARMVYSMTAKGEAWLRVGAGDQVRALYAAWRDDILWAEMSQDSLSKAGVYHPKEAMLDLRQAALDILRPLDGEHFYELDSPADALVFHRPMLPAQCAAMGGELVASPAVFMRRLIAQCLFWLGLVELDRADAPPPPPSAPTPLTSRKTGAATKADATAKSAVKSSEPTATAFRFTPLGRHLLADAEAPPEPPREDKFIVQANAEIFTPPYLEPKTLHQLLSLTEPPAKDAAGNVVRLTRDSIRRALDAGMTQRDILLFLQTGARAGIPQNIEYLIREVADKHGHIRVGLAKMYVQTDSPLLLKELQARKEFKPYFVRALSDTVAILQADDLDKLLRELRKAGYLPTSDEQPPPRMTYAASRSGEADLAVLFPKPTKRKSERAEDDVIDWERIAREDDKPWNLVAPPAPPSPLAPKSGFSTPSTVPPPDSVRDRTQIVALIREAIKEKTRIEICYSIPGNRNPISRIVEPRALVGDALSVFLPATRSYHGITIDKAIWARNAEE